MKNLPGDSQKSKIVEEAKEEKLDSQTSKIDDENDEMDLIISKLPNDAEEQ